MVRLNLGCGDHPIENWTNIDKDPKVGANVFHDLLKPLPYENDSVDEILISHTLMYFNKKELYFVLGECYRVLKQGKIIRITEDNVFIKQRNEQQQEQYGHGILLSRLGMEDVLKSVGFRGIREADPFEETAHHLKVDPLYPLPSGLESVYFLIAHKGLPKTERKVYITFDDFGEKVSNLDMLWKLRDYFDDFKVSLFAVPDWCARPEWMEYVSTLDWIDLYIHGFFHKEGEELDDKTLEFLTRRYFRRGYKGPLWEISDDMFHRLQKLQFMIFLEPTDPREGIKYNWDIRNAPPRDMELQSYGHVYLHDYPAQDANSLVRYVDNIMQLPRNTSFELY